MTSAGTQRPQLAQARYTCSACGAAYGQAEPRWRCDCRGVLDLDSPKSGRQIADLRDPSWWPASD